MTSTFNSLLPFNHARRSYTPATRRNTITPQTTHLRCNRARNCTPTPEMAPSETPYSCLSMPYASKTDPAPHQGTYRITNGPDVSGTGPLPRNRIHRLEIGPVASTATPPSQKPIISKAELTYDTEFKSDFGKKSLLYRLVGKRGEFAAIWDALEKNNDPLVEKAGNAGNKPLTAEDNADEE
ncbi:hypothetical protein BS17DRAFT_808548 [Gyrodon lividus]|nr:hypothetical protein BS17DRAFT_808548 [Gyrodon lividus]